MAPTRAPPSTCASRSEWRGATTSPLPYPTPPCIGTARLGCLRAESNTECEDSASITVEVGSEHQVEIAVPDGARETYAEIGGR